MSTLTFQSPLSKEENEELKRQFAERLRQRIREIRKTKKLTQEELADKACLHLTYVGHIEVGKYRPSTFVLWKISKALEVSLDELINF